MYSVETLESIIGFRQILVNLNSPTIFIQQQLRENRQFAIVARPLNICRIVFYLTDIPDCMSAWPRWGTDSVRQPTGLLSCSGTLTTLTYARVLLAIVWGIRTNVLVGRSYAQLVFISEYNNRPDLARPLHRHKVKRNAHGLNHQTSWGAFQKRSFSIHFRGNGLNWQKWRLGKTFKKSCFAILPPISVIIYSKSTGDIPVELLYCPLTY